jgi:DNA-binding NarL/FixJ family response regulator
MPGASQSDAAALARAWPLIGRDRELEKIAAARAERGCNGVVIVAGAGIGKSRLAREALAAAERAGAFVQWVQATRSAAAVPLAAVAELVPDTVRSDDALALLRRCGEELRARAGRKPVVLGVDDAQLLDSVSAALVLHLGTSGSALILATVRSGEPCPDAIESLWKDGAARRIELGELADEDVRTLIETALGDPVEEAAVRWVTEVSRGNPLYVRELVNGAVEAGTLVRSPGFWRLAGRPVATLSLIELVERRLAVLGDGERTAAELLALGEPLRVEEIAGLTSEETLLAAEAHGVVAMRGDGVGLAHPLYGEAVRLALPPLRARALRLRLAGVLEARAPFGSDDALRVARLRLDAGATLAPELVIDAARAANHAGDPELGAQLAELAGAGSNLTAGMLLAQARAMRNRHAEAEAALAAVEHLAPGSPDAGEYLKQRVSLYHWSLRRSDDAAPLLDRAESWSGDPRWQTFVARLGRTYTALADGFGEPSDSAVDTLPEGASGEPRRSIGAMHAMAMFLAGDGDAAAAAVFAARPPVPLRDPGDSATLASLSLIALETGYCWDAFEDYMSGVLRDGVRVHDHTAAGLAAFALGRLQFLRDRHLDAARWLSEAEVHLLQHDPYGVMTHVRVLQVGVASFGGDFDGAAAALQRLRAWSAEHTPLPIQHVPVRRAEGWAERLRNPLQAGRRLLEDATAFAQMPGLAAQLAYDAMRAGVPAAEELVGAADRCSSRLVTAYARHAAAKEAHEPTALLAAADEFAQIGALRYAVEAASDAASAFVAAGRQDSARRAAARARELHVPDQGGELPRIDGLDSTATSLTPREEQLIVLASQGLSNAEIADRLVISVRTVETHLYRGMQKLGVSDRRKLSARRT